ncbi:MAG: periplasmic heavy metal sensor [Gammaproteobacteria bacterium]|nr:periplasmic heavy metal sensor [Gammaproteobacteria bacterium]MDH3465754.1 periplasmic heavy metal sensor [Gammaproteobacteria bacterium]
MKRSTKIITAVVLTLGVAGGAAAYGKHRFGSPESRANYMVGYVSEELSLSSTQEQSLNALKDEIMTARRTMRRQMKSARDEVQSLISSERFDRERALELIDGKAAAITEAAPTVVAALGNFLDGLNVEQKEEIMEFVQHRAEHHRHYKHNGE